MSKNRTGNFIAGGKPQIPSLSLNNGVFDTNEVYESVGSNKWQSAGSGAFEIARSLRFRRSATAFFSKTMGVPTNNRIFTYSGWVKLALTAGGSYSLFSGHNTDENNELWLCWTSEKFVLQQTVNGSGQAYAATNAVFRDPSAWYHVVVALDSTQATALNRVKLYVNGVQQTFSSYSGLFLNNQNFTPWMNYNGAPHRIGQLAPPNNGAMDGYMAEVNFVDGQALEPSAFGYFDPITNIWQPKRYTGAYGNNGFYLPFTENQTTTNLGRNFAGGTNIVRTSNNIADANFNKINGSATANATIAPDGTLTAGKYVENTGTSGHDINLNYFPTVTFGAPYTFSFYAKKANTNRGTFVFNVVNNSYASGFSWQADLNKGTVIPAGAVAGNGTAYGHGIEYVGNDWYRVWGSGSFSNAGSASGMNVTFSLGQDNGTTFYTGDGSSGMFLWGWQINLGTTPDRYFHNNTSSSLINDWTPNNFSVTAGITYDSMVDSPTNVFTTANDIGGVVSGNYPTLNRAFTGGAGATLSNGNLTCGPGAGNWTWYPSTIMIPSTGKWYWEFTFTTVYGSNAGSAEFIVAGVIRPSVAQLNFSRANMLYVADTGWVYNFDNNVNSAGRALIANEIVSFAIDRDANTYTVYLNNTVLRSGTLGSTTGEDLYAFATSYSGNGVGTINFGQRPFAYTPPAGFRSLNTTNIQALGTSTVGNAAVVANKHFDTSVYTGLGLARDIKNSGFRPDFVWIKARAGTRNHTLVDSVRGPTVNLMSNAAFADGIWSSVTNFNSDGFSLGTDSNENGSGEPFVAWQWRAGDTTVTNTAGNITSQVRANPTAGFSIVSYTLNNSTFTVGHGLGVAPKMILVKNRDTTNNWDVYHANTGAGVRLQLNSTAGTTSTTQVWNNTAPTSTVFSGNSAWWSNPSTSKMIAYCFAEVPGFSRFGTWVGNGSTTDGPFVNLGFSPKWIMVKKVGEDSWGIFDTTRDNRGNLTGFTLLADSNQAEFDRRPTGYIDILSNGIKIRDASTLVNHSGFTYIYAAFAESPFALNNRAR
jgi:hypothetical protein